MIDYDTLTIILFILFVIIYLNKKFNKYSGLLLSSSIGVGLGHGLLKADFTIMSYSIDIILSIMMLIIFCFMNNDDTVNLLKHTMSKIKFRKNK